MNAELLRPLPFHEPSRLLQVAEKMTSSTSRFWRLGLELPFMARAAEFISEIAAVGFQHLYAGWRGQSGTTLRKFDQPGADASAGLSPVAGRTFTDDEEKPGAHLSR